MSSLSSSSSNNIANNKRSSWSAVGCSQTDLMQTDTVLVVDINDTVIGRASKQQAHVFNETQPHGVLHRAFSVFLFDSAGRLLLQQRAATKVTFPNVWTNTCCSHPLHDMEPSEVDHDIVSGNVEGLRAAAHRKLAHELGLTTFLDLQFLTRVYYWARDETNPAWGEHEIDSLLVAQLPHAGEQTSLSIDEDEIRAIQWVTYPELIVMMQQPELSFSPWFKLIAQKFLFTWWGESAAALRNTMTTKVHCDYETIHRLVEPPAYLLSSSAEASSAASAASAVVVNNNGTSTSTKSSTLKKQGAYGKIPIHSESKWKQLRHGDEIRSMIQLLLMAPLLHQNNLQSTYIRQRYQNTMESRRALEFCDRVVQKVSRSFAAVIRQLPAVLLVDVMVFYLVLRALDTIEDETVAFATHGEKIKQLLDFTPTALRDEEVVDSSSAQAWSMDGAGHGEERHLLQEFRHVQLIFRALPITSRQIIVDITSRMASGMAEFVSKDMGEGTVDMEEYNKYCHYVAGLVGEGLSRLFAASKLESERLEKEIELSDKMGLFLQKTNIIRDYLEDYVDGRAFWPQSIWKKYAPTGQLGYFVDQHDPQVQLHSLLCLNELITDALELVPDCLEYLSFLQCFEIFRFCAIPQVMAMATLEKCFANLNVFTGVVKIRKGLSCKLILRTNSLSQVHTTFFDLATNITLRTDYHRRQNQLDDATARRTIQICKRIRDLTRPATRYETQLYWWRVATIICPVLVWIILSILPRVWKTFLPNDQGELELPLRCLQAICIVTLGLFYNDQKHPGRQYASWPVLTKARVLEKKVSPLLATNDDKKTK